MSGLLQGKIVFVTGGSGYLGTTLVSRLVFDTAIAYIYILVRGGEGHLFSKWSKVLPLSLYNSLVKSEKIIAIEGDITLPSMGMTFDDQTRVRESHYIVHAASSINLAAPLGKIATSIIQGSHEVATFALSCSNLERFVYISTAYANSHLHQLHCDIETVVEEQIYQLGHQDGIRGAEEEYQELKLRGTTKEYEASDFPWAYGYAKHLTERLLMRAFTEGLTEKIQPRDGTFHNRRKLLIVRPSIIGPAKQWPYPGFEIQGSVPSSALAAGLMLETSLYMKFSTRFTDPWNEANLNEVPVDVVANQIIMHLAYETQGIVHAVCPDEERISFREIWYAVRKVRRLPWMPEIIWEDLHWHSEKLSALARVYVIFGTSYSFTCTSASVLAKKMSCEEHEKFPLFLTNRDGIHSTYDLSSRGLAILGNIEWYFRKRWWLLWIVRWLC